MAADMTMNKTAASADSGVGLDRTTHHQPEDKGEHENDHVRHGYGAPARAIAERLRP